MEIQGKKYLCLVASLAIWLWFVDALGLLLAESKGLNVGSMGQAMAAALGNDFIASVFIGIFFLIPMYCMDRWRGGLGFGFAAFSFGATLLLNAVLTRYFSETLLYLGSDLLGYSRAEIWATLTSIEDLSLVYVIPVFVLMGGYWLTFIQLFSKVQTKYIIRTLVPISMMGAISLFSTGSFGNQYVRNKIVHLSSDIVSKKARAVSLANASFEAEYPLLRSSEELEDVLGPFLNVVDQRPNFVFIVCEGLGRDFTGHEAEYAGFTPFLDSLADKSLTWDNFVCNSGRSFGIMGSLFGSLPFGDNGFLELESPPNHLSLLSVLNRNGYEVSYLEGSSSSFDRKINFLEYHGVKNVIDRSNYGPDYEAAEENELGFSWGYPDREIFKRALVASDDSAKPRLDLIFTVSGHEPFVFPDRPKYEDRVRRMLDDLPLAESKKKVISANGPVFASLLYTDEAIREFLQAYAKRPEYDRTIFIITGDHRLIPIPHRNEICRFHVPFMIHSPMVKKPVRFSSVSSHLDVVPSLLAFLKENYNQEVGPEFAWLGDGIDTARIFRSEKKIPLMKHKGGIHDYISGEYMVSRGELLKIKDGMSLDGVEDKVQLDAVKKEMNHFLQLNKYLVENDRILPLPAEDLEKAHQHDKRYSEAELKWIARETKDLDNDALFLMARDLAWNGEKEKARLICDYILTELPNHFDARILKARSLAWDGLHSESEREFLDVIRRNPYYYDSYLGALDLYWWSGEDDKALDLGGVAKENQVDHPELKFKMARLYKRLNKMKLAIDLTEGLLKEFPENTDYLKFRESFN